MWHSGVSGPGAGRVGYRPGLAGGDTPAVAPVTEVSAARQLLDELFDAQQSGKNQTVQDTRDKLNALREKMGDEAFKDVLKKMIEEADEKFRAFLRQLLMQWFPDDGDAPSPAPPVQPGGGGGRGPSVPRSGFGPSESMSNKPITEGAKHFNYTPDNSNPGKKPDNIWSGFRQGPDGNCITVSAIKAAMMQFGQKPTDVFKEVKATANGYDVTMRDGFKLSLTRDEVKQAARYAQFKGDDPAMMTDANFMYAASAKRAQMENNDGTAGRSFTDAMNSLNDGEFAREGLDRLGLRNHYRMGQARDFREGMVGTVEYGGHSMAVIGNRVELWGRRGGQPGEGTMTVLYS